MYYRKRNISELIDVALGKKNADMIVEGGKVVDVYTGEIYTADVAVSRGRIAYVGDAHHTIGKNTQRINASNKYIVPGLIEMHEHVGGSQLSVTEFAKVLLMNGTTGILTDFYEMGIVGGSKAIQFCIEEIKRTPLKVFYQVPSQIYLQNSPFGNTNKVKDKDLFDLLHLPECVGISEWPRDKIFIKDPVIIKLIEETLNLGKKVIGHLCEMHDPKELNAYVAAGATSDHEAVTIEELIMWLRHGVRQTIREGGAAKDLLNVIKAVTEHKLDPRYLMYCTDEDDPLRLVEQGHLNKKIRMSINQGVNPIEAIRMATINAAEYLDVFNEMGSINPGRIADILIVEDLTKFNIRKVIANGKVIAEDGVFTGEIESPEYPEWFYNTVKMKQLVKAEDFVITSKQKNGETKVRVIGQIGGLLITEYRTAKMMVSNGIILPDIDKDILKIVYVERHQATGRIGKGFVQGFNIKRGAIASSFNPQCENILAIGTTDDDIAVAINHVAKCGGGFVVVKDKKVIAEMRLPLLGLMSDKSYINAIGDLKTVDKAVKDLGGTLESPFTQMAFIGVPVEIGNLKICEYGLVDVWKRELVEVEVE